METTATTKAERNARVLEGFILAGEKECAWLMAQVEATREDDPEAAAKLRAQWGRVSRRTMQAMVLDAKFDRMAVEARHTARMRGDGKPAPEPDPQCVQLRADILAAFRVDGLDRDDEIELKDLLEEMDDEELLHYPVIENVGRISQSLNWEPPSVIVKAAHEARHHRRHAKAH